MQKNFSISSFKKLNLSPIFFLNLSLILGIIIKKNNFTFLPVFLLIALISFIFDYYIKNKIDTFFIYPIFFLFGAIVFQNQQIKFDDFIKKFSHKQFDAICVIQDITIKKSLKKNLILNIEKIIIDENSETINQTINLCLNKESTLNNLQIADKIKIKNIIIKFPNNYTRDNLIKESLSANAYTNKFSYSFITKPYFSINRFFKELRNKTFNNLKSKINPETFALFSSIFLGNKKEEIKILYRLKKLFNNWGLAHYLARSGLHLVIVFLSWFILISIFPFSYYIKQIIICFIILIYSLLSWSSIPFIRSLITFLLYKICIFFDLQINTLHCLNIACIIMLLLNPFHLFFLDFQLSFLLTFSLIWINSIKLN